MVVIVGVEVEAMLIHVAGARVLMATACVEERRREARR
jgi:tartrate dehydratase alpha subunit/fumarate hydratase class I-like protein